MDAIMDSFHPVVRSWFEKEIGKPSPPQKGGWPLIARKENVLITAPTGSGKTLAAFLQCINFLCSGGLEEGKDGVRILYISPLKALNNDIYRNLELPLKGIRNKAEQMGVDIPVITHAVRTGDTPQKERRQMQKKPPHILITTPESLYLILTANKTRDILRTVEYVIIDEIHSLCGEKRGVHLALSLERLEALTQRPFARIGLSATIHPLDQAARYLGGGAIVEGKWTPRPVSIVDTGRQKQLDIYVSVPTPDLKVLPEGTIWPSIYSQVLSLVKAHLSTLVFVNNRATAEKLALNLNVLAGELVARTHHGCISKESRLEVEQQLKQGKLACLVATSSLELGIDVGAIDLVVQVASPKSVSRGLQRIGRAGHRLDVPSRGFIIPRTRGDLLEASVVAGEMLKGQVESTRVPQNCLDILAQQLVAMSVNQEWELEELFQLITRAYPYHALVRGQLINVLNMLAGDVYGSEDEPESPKLVWDRINKKVRGNAYGKLLAVSNAGTIPDRGYYGVYLEDGKTRIGELDEVFVFESRQGERFVLGTSTWRIVKIEKDRVVVAPSTGMASKMPFWTGEGLGRPFEFGLRFGAFLRETESRLDHDEFIPWMMQQCPIDAVSAQNLQNYLIDQRSAAMAIPTDRRMVVEYFSDEVGDQRIVVHSIFGGRVNGVLAILLEHYVRQTTRCHVESNFSDNGILLHIMGYRGNIRNIFSLLPSKELEQTLVDDLPKTPMFSAVFRYNAARSLMLGVRNRRRSPLWIMRMRALEAQEVSMNYTDHPLILETFRECLEEVLDIPDLQKILSGILSGSIRVVETDTLIPSPFTSELLFSFMGFMMYEGQMPKAEKRNELLLSNREMLRLHLGAEVDAYMLDPRAVSSVIQELKGSYRRKPLKDADELHRYLLMHGDMISEGYTSRQLDELCHGEAREWLYGLEEQGRVIRMQISGDQSPRWIAVEDYLLYCTALGMEGIKTPALFSRYSATIDQQQAVQRLLRRFARFQGPFGVKDIVSRYPFTLRLIEGVLGEMEQEGILLKGKFTGESDEEQWCHAAVLDRIRKKSLQMAKKEMKAVESEKFSEFILQKHHIDEKVLSGPERLLEIMEQLEGLFLPAAWWEDFIFPLRMAEYRKSYLDQLCATGRAEWVGRKEGNILKIAWRANADLALGRQAKEENDLGEGEKRILDFLKEKGASFLFNITRAVGVDTSTCLELLEQLVWKGWVTNDSFEALRFFLLGNSNSPKGKARRSAMAHRLEMGRWSLVSDAEETHAEQEVMRISRLYGFITKEIWERDNPKTPWSEVGLLLKQMELLGKLKRGYYLAGLTGIQYSWGDTLDHLRQIEIRDQYVALPACDPAVVFGGIYPKSTMDGGWISLPGTVLILYRGKPIMVVERYGESIRPIEDAGDDILTGAVRCLAQAFHERRFWQDVHKMKLCFWGSERAGSCSVTGILRSAGFEREMQDMVLWRKTVH